MKNITSVLSQQLKPNHRLMVASILFFALLFLIAPTAQAASNQPTQITITNASGKVLLKGKTYKLSYTLTSEQNLKKANKRVSFSSSNRRVASVNSKGVIKGNRNGTAIITAKTVNNLKATYTIKVGYPVTEVKVSGSSSVVVGRKISLKSAILPRRASRQAVYWSSSDKSVAIVSAGGTVSGIASGTATITATAKDGSGKKGSKTITVIALPNKPEFISLNESNFPDSVFRAYIKDSFDINKDDKLSISEIESVTNITITNAGCTSLKGIEFFKNLKTLDCSNTSRLPLISKLKSTCSYLDEQLNLLTNLNVSNNTALTSLDCSGNQIVSLDISNNASLTSLDCSNNQLASLNVSGNPALVSLDCSNNQLTNLDVSKNTALTELKYDVASVIVTGQQPISIESTKTVVPAIPALVPINEMYFPDAVFRQYVNENFDTDKDGKLSQAERDAAEVITFLGRDRSDCSSLKGIELFPNLKELICPDSKLTSLDVSNNTALTVLGVWRNNITHIDVTQNKALTYLVTASNPISSLDVRNNTALEILGCDGNQLSTLDVSNNTELLQLTCMDAPLTELDVSHNTKLSRFCCSSTKLTNLDISKNTELRYLDCSSNNLKTLNISNNGNLNVLICSGNQLSSLDISKNTELSKLDCTSKGPSNTGNNQISVLDVSNNPKLYDLRCNQNKITALDISKNPALQYLDCCGNQLSALDVTENPGLSFLNCGGNLLTSLNVSNNLVLATLICSNNQLSVLDVSANTLLQTLRYDTNSVVITGWPK